MKITELELYQAKEKCLRSENENQRLVLKGHNPVLVISQLLDARNIKEGELDKILSYDGVALNNYISSSYTDALTCLLHEKLGVHGIVSYLPLKEHSIENRYQLFSGNMYQDEQIQKLIQKENIQAIMKTKIGTMVDKDVLSFTEMTSSFAFAGCSGFSIGLEEQLDKKGIPNHNGFHIYPRDEQFKLLGYDFTDDTILYNRLVGLGKPKGEMLPQERMWPRTMEIGFSSSMDNMSAFLEGAGEVANYIQTITKELEDKGVYDALGPMRPKQKRK